jgi:hypothetical protein
MLGWNAMRGLLENGPGEQSDGTGAAPVHQLVGCVERSTILAPKEVHSL